MHDATSPAASWPLLPLRRYLAAMIALALLPLAAWVCWQVVRDVRQEQRELERSLVHAAGMLAQSFTVAAADGRPGEAAVQALLGPGAPPGGLALLQDARGGVLASNGSAPDSTLPDATRQALRDRTSGMERLPGIGGGAVYVAWQRLPDGSAVAAAMPADAIDAARHRLIFSAIGASGLSLWLGVVLASLVSRRLAEPLRELAVGRTAALRSPVHVQELQALREALDDAARRNDQARQVLEEDIARRQEVQAQLLAAHGQLRSARERAEQAQAEAEAASRAKDEVLSMLGHELRNPMGAISAAADVLEAAPPQSPLAQEARTIVTRQTRNLARLVDDLLDAGRVITGTAVLARAPVDLATVVQRVRATLELTGRLVHHHVEFAAAPAWVHGDAVRLEQVATHLLGNALTYTPPGGRVKVRVAREHGQAVLEVSDTGPGIAPDLLPRVFELFAQGERAPDRALGGLGLGLALVRRLVGLHHGEVQASSSPAGSVFRLTLPAIDPPAERDAGELPPSRRRHVLVVDDNLDVLAALRSKLELDGHQVTTASDGRDALHRLLTQQPEVSIVDIGLPGLTGLDVARQARAAGYAGHMIALSGYGQSRNVREALGAGFDAYLVKPVERTQLRACLAD